MAQSKVYDVTVNKCERCGHVWISKVDDPVICPGRGCRSPYWNRPKINKIQIPVSETKQTMKKINKLIEEATKIEPPEEIPKITFGESPDVIVVKDLAKTVDHLKNEGLVIKPKDASKEGDTVEKQCFDCALRKNFVCDVYNAVATGKKAVAEETFCKDCVDSKFWTAKDLYQEVSSDDLAPVEDDNPKIQFTEQVDENNPEYLKKMSYACNKKMKAPNNVVFCPYKDRANILYPYCTMCWELEEIWGKEASGYYERRGGRK